MPEDKVNADEVMEAAPLMELRELLQERGEVDSEIKERESLKRDLTVKITGLMSDTGHLTMRTDAWNLTISPPTTRYKLDELKLIEAGVSVEQLDNGKIPIEVKPSLRVTKRKQVQVHAR